MGRDEEAERAVERWVRLGDEVVVGKKGGEREDQATSDDRAFCARCFLERGTSRTIE